VEHDERQERRDRRREKERNRMLVHKVKSPRTGERLVKLVVKHALRAQGIKLTKASRAIRGVKPRRRSVS